MTVHLHAEIHVRPGHMNDMLDLLEHTIKPMMEGEGVKMLACYTAATGRRNTIIDIWEMDDMEHFRAAYARSLGKLAPEDDLRGKLDSWVEREVLTFMDRRF